MPYDSEGNFTRVHSWEEDRVNNIDIMSDRHDEEDDNFTEGLNLALLRDGRVPMQGNLNMNNFQIKGVANASVSSDAVNKAQLDALDNAAVHKEGDETISGNKSFVGSANFESEQINIKKSNMEKRVMPAQTLSCFLNFKDKNNERVGCVGFEKDVNGHMKTLFLVESIDENSQAAYFGVEKDTQQGEYAIASSGVIRSIIDWMMPDYGSGMDIASGSTVNKSGYLRIYANGNNRHCWVQVNGTEVFQSTWEATYGSPDSSFIPVAAGSVITYSGVSVKFFKCKGV